MNRCLRYHPARYHDSLIVEGIPSKWRTIMVPGMIVSVLKIDLYDP